MHGRETQASRRRGRRDTPDKEHKAVAVELPLPPEGLLWGSFLPKIIIKLHTMFGVLYGVETECTAPDDDTTAAHMTLS
jgi:hypothetical protein